MAQCCRHTCEGRYPLPLNRLWSLLIGNRTPHARGELFSKVRFNFGGLKNPAGRDEYYH